MAKKLKINENSRTLIQKIDKKWTDKKTGKVYVKAHWEELTEPLDFGSLKEPKNINVIGIKFEIPEDRNFQNPFFRFFG